MATDVTLVLRADNSQYVNKIKEAQQATQKLYDESEKGMQREKGLIGDGDIVDKTDRAGSSPWDRVIPSDKVRCIVGDVEFGISADAYSAFLKVAGSKDEAEGWMTGLLLMG